MTDETLRAAVALCRSFLREGEQLRDPFDWTIRPDAPAWVVEAGYPVAGQSFNAFAVGWGPTPEAAYDSLGWKLVERSTSSHICWPFRVDRWPEWPSVEEAERDREHMRRSMYPPEVAERYIKQVWPDGRLRRETP
jgi:hypothetical protein